MPAHTPTVASTACENDRHLSTVPFPFPVQVVEAQSADAALVRLESTESTVGAWLDGFRSRALRSVEAGRVRHLYVTAWEEQGGGFASVCASGVLLLLSPALLACAGLPCDSTQQGQRRREHGRQHAARAAAESTGGSTQQRQQRRARAVAHAARAGAESTGASATSQIRARLP